MLVTDLPPAPKAGFAKTEELVVSVFTGAVIKALVAVATTATVGLGRAGVIVVAPFHHALSTTIKFLSVWAHGDTLSVLVDGSSLARRFAMVLGD